MGNQSQHRTDIEKLNILLPYWVNRNDHIRDQEKWLKKAEKEGLIAVADELTMAIEHSKKAARHVERANLRLKSKKAVDREKIINAEDCSISPGQETSEQGIVNFSLKQIGVIRTPYTDNAPYQPLMDDEGDFRIIVN